MADLSYDPDTMAQRDRYKLLISLVIPRPIALVTTVGPTGIVNAAPFSFFNIFSEHPPLCVLGTGGTSCDPRRSKTKVCAARGRERSEKTNSHRAMRMKRPPGIWLGPDGRDYRS